MRSELSDYGWSVIRPMLPSKSRGISCADDRPCVDDRPVRTTGALRAYEPTP